MSETYTEYGLFVQHGSSEVLLKTFRKAETVGIWRTVNPEVAVSSVRKRTVTRSVGDWMPLRGDS